MSRVLTCVWSLSLVCVACSQSGVPGRPARADHDNLLAEAQHEYWLTRETPAVEKAGVKIGHGQPVMKIEVSSIEMHRKNMAAPEKHHWVGALRSDTQYDGLGLGVGYNYVFYIAGQDAAHSYVVVPEDKSLPVRYLVYDPTNDLMQGMFDAPLAIKGKVMVKTDNITIGGCFEGPCTTGHCSTTDAGDLY